MSFAHTWSSSTLLTRVLLLFLAYNALVGFISSVISHNREFVLYSPPTHYAGWWLPVIGIGALVCWRISNKVVSRLLALLFYFLQLVAIYGAVEINWWVGINYGLEFGDIETDKWVAVFNVAAFLFFAAHLWQIRQTNAG